MAKTPNAIYWDKRAIARLNTAERTSDTYIKSIKKMYDKAYRNVDSEIKKIYKNYSKATGVDVDTLKTLLTKKETTKVYKELKAKGYDQYVKDNYKSRITRLEQVKAQIYSKAKEVYTEEELLNHDCYKNVVNNSYYRTIYDTQKGTGYDFSFSSIDNRVVDRLLNEKWSGKNYSQRIWRNTDILAKSVSEVVGAGLLSGQDIYKTSKEIRDRFKVCKYYAERLVRTETNHFNNEADALAYEEMGVKKYVFVATLDSRTSEICQEHDNKVFEYKNKEIGYNYPPLHPNCRSTTRGYVNEEAEKTLKRRARNPFTGETELIPNINYKEWVKQYNVVDTKNGMFRTKNNVIYNTTSLNKLNGKLVETNAKQLDKLLNKYPKVNNYIKQRGLTFGGSNKTNAIAYTSYTRDLSKIGIYLEKPYYTNTKSHIDTISKGVNRGNFMPCNDKYFNRYALTHEYGHVVETYLLNEYNINNPVEYKNALSSQYNWKKYKDKVYNDIRKDVINIAIKNNSNFDIDTQLSQYGKTSPAEFFAECFANMECGKSNELGKALKEYLKGVM